jgi:dual specificity tyrosine-phosphorylation-regulated kinase 2/3/4
MAEFAMGYPIFPGEDETDQLSLMMEVFGIPPSDVLKEGQRKTKFFND